MREQRFMFKGIGVGLLLSLLFSFAACNSKKGDVHKVASDNTEEVADSTVYGVCGDGTSMHSLELITDAGDTLVYTILDSEADFDGDVDLGESSTTDVAGGLMAGDKMAVVGHKADGELIADRVLNVTSLLGRWTSIDKNFEIEEGGTVKSSVKAETTPWTSWKILNGNLLLNRDTFNVTSLGADSLYIENSTGIFTFKRVK